MEFFGGFEVGTFAGDNPDELAGGFGPVGKEGGGLLAAGFREVEFDELFDLGNVVLAFDREGDDHLGVDSGEEFPIDVIDECGAA